MTRDLRKVLWGPAALLWAAVAVPGPLGAGSAGDLAARWTAYGRRILPQDARGAEKAFAKATKLDPQSGAAWEGLIEAFQAEGKDEQARWAYRQMARVAPNAAASGYVMVKGWPQPSGRIAGYYLYMSEVEVGGFQKVSPLITGISYTVQGLLPGRRYFFMLSTATHDSPPVESKPSNPWSMVARAR